MALRLTFVSLLIVVIFALVFDRNSVSFFWQFVCRLVEVSLAIFIHYGNMRNSPIAFACCYFNGGRL